MDFQKVMQTSGKLKCDLVETSLAKALIYQEAGCCKLESYGSLFHVKSDIGMDWVLPAIPDQKTVISRVSTLANSGAEILIPTSLVDTRWIPKQVYYTFIGSTSKMTHVGGFPAYMRYNRVAERYRTIYLYGQDSYDPDTLMALYNTYSPAISVSVQPEEGAVLETLLLQRPWFADLVALKGLILQERQSEDAPWKSIGCIISAHLSQNRWGVLYRFSSDPTIDTYLTARTAFLYFSSEFDDGCSWNHPGYHLYKSQMADRMIPLYQAQALRKGANDDS